MVCQTSRAPGRAIPARLAADAAGQLRIEAGARACELRDDLPQRLAHRRERFTPRDLRVPDEKHRLQACFVRTAEELDVGDAGQPARRRPVPSRQLHQPLSRPPKQRRRDRTHTDRQEVVGRPAAVTYAKTVTRLFHPQPDAIAIAPLRPRPHFDLPRKDDAGRGKDPSQDFDLERQLCAITGVLVLAAAALPEVDAPGLDSRGRRGKHRNSFRPRLDQFAGQHEEKGFRSLGCKRSAIVRRLYRHWFQESLKPDRLSSLVPYEVIPCLTPRSVRRFRELVAVRCANQLLGLELRERIGRTLCERVRLMQAVAFLAS